MHAGHYLLSSRNTAYSLHRPSTRDTAMGGSHGNIQFPIIQNNCPTIFFLNFIFNSKSTLKNHKESEHLRHQIYKKTDVEIQSTHTYKQPMWSTLTNLSKEIKAPGWLEMKIHKMSVEIQLITFSEFFDSVSKYIII